jgi:hypothetical protein
MTFAVTPPVSLGLDLTDANPNSEILSTEGDAVYASQEPCSLLAKPNLTDPAARQQNAVSKLTVDDFDTDGDEDEVSTGRVSSVHILAQRKHAQKVAFEKFVNQKDKCLLKKKLAEFDTKLSVGTNSKDGTGFGKIIDNVRDYQSELYARAKASNVIAVLGTGCGKTLVAALLLRDVVTQERDDRASGKSRRTSFFLVCLSCAFDLYLLTSAHVPGKQRCSCRATASNAFRKFARNAKDGLRQDIRHLETAGMDRLILRLRCYCLHCCSTTPMS